MDDGACAGNQGSRLRISKLPAGGKLQSTWEHNMPLCWLIQPTIRLNKTESLPIVGNGVVALAVINGEGPAPVFSSPKILNFTGYEWKTSTGPIFRAGSRNFFDRANVWTDERGALHLRISGSPGKWAAAELRLTRSLGYGTYRFRVGDVCHLEPSALLTLKEMANWLELGGDFFDGLNQEALWSRLVKKLVSLGYQVTLTPASSEAAARAL